MNRLTEIHLYQGNRCNRACQFCTVNGSPRGWFAEHTREAIALAAGLVAPDGVVKVFGGECTLEPEATMRVIRTLRELGFEGLLCLFSNGDNAEELIRLLDASPPAAAVLNYSVWTGRDAHPLADPARAALLAYEEKHPGSIQPGHEEYYASGRAAALDVATRAECPHCMPSILPDGCVHACPFAVERDLPVYRLGDARDGPAVIIERIGQFMEWLDGPQADLARALGVDPCIVCERHLDTIEPPAFVRAEAQR